ncbi:MAG: Biopolymer transport protein ExbD/TolR [Verrucomicrobiota bacterium]|jgi:biopolymer transport protein ExbD
MKFTRTLKPLKGQFELAPYLCVVFVLLFFMLFGGYLVLPVGTRLELPPGGSRSGTWTGDAFLVVAVDAGEQCYFENQIVPDLAILKTRLTARANAPKGPRKLYLQADRSVRYERLQELATLAREAGLSEILLGGGGGNGGGGPTGTQGSPEGRRPGIPNP